MVDGAADARGAAAVERGGADGAKGFGVASSALIGALSQAFRYPQEGIEATLGALREVAAQRGGFADRALRELMAARAGLSDRTAEQLAYTRLFIGSFHMEAPPYASYYLDGGMVGGRTSSEVEAVYRQFGLSLGSAETSPPDHLRYLLAFLALLARRFEEAGARAFADAYADFRDAYVLSWTEPFRARVQRAAEYAYYPTLVSCIDRALRDEPCA